VFQQPALYFHTGSCVQEAKEQIALEKFDRKVVRDLPGILSRLAPDSADAGALQAE
jgi:hypothetical protein